MRIPAVVRAAPAAALLASAFLASALLAAAAAAQEPARTLVAVFAHADDERIVGPLLARYAREGHDVHLVIATDGAKGITEHAGIPAGDSLADLRAEEAHCAARRLGIHPPILLGHEDAGLASFASLGRLRADVARVFAELRPDAVVTFGPEGGTGHPDHRLVGIVVTEVVQRGGEGVPEALFYPSLPTERMESAPPARPSIATMPAARLTVAVPFTRADLTAGHEAFACHATQYTREQVDRIMRYLDYGWEGAVRLRPWLAPGEARTGLFER